MIEKVFTEAGELLTEIESSDSPPLSVGEYFNCDGVEYVVIARDARSFTDIVVITAARCAEIEAVVNG